MSYYVPNTAEDQKEMMEKIGVDSIEDLFQKIIPPELRAKSFDLPPGKTEMETINHFKRLGMKNKIYNLPFVGGGFYDHYVPTAIDALASRSEFYTAYTPYQPEAAQGTLQAIYEFQTCICRLTGMDAANASLYDGGTALYEAVMMALRITRRNKVIVDGGVSPIYRKMLYCYTKNLHIEFVETPVSHGHASRDNIREVLDDQTAAVILQNPNFFGAIDEHSDIADMVHDKKALLIESVYPIAQALLKTPAEMGADIVTGEGQSLGIPLSFGGPYLGFMATLKKHVRKMPGRIAGATLDEQGRRGFVLTLQAREQHIRREKAASNICTNQTLCATRALMYMCLMGREGMKHVAQLCMDKAEYAKQKIEAIEGVEVMRSSPTFNEFVVKLPKDPDEIIAKMMEYDIAAGFPLGRYYPDMQEYILVAVTEKRSKQEIAMYAEALEAALCN
ncbi:MAG: aminomethyl-transferring glycine dehydrogenase subunit GcvPA [Candidatus Sumerlaeia bacterium]